MFRKITEAVIVLLCCSIALYESALGLMQVFGLRASGHAGFALTGTFSNPGPYGGFIAVLLAVLASYAYMNRKSENRFVRVVVLLSGLSALMCFLVLPASMSRAAWLSFSVAALVFAFSEGRLAYWMSMYKGRTLIVSVALVVLLIGAFFMKKDSAIGRLHIWHMELRAIAEKPFSGHGKGSFLGVYGQTQAEYFSYPGSRPETIIRVAGCPEYAFNEYLKIGVEYGIPAMLAVIAILIFTVSLLGRRRSPFAYGLIAFCVFAFFSYPLSALKPKSEAEKEWESLRYLSQMELYDDAVEEYAPFYEQLNDNYRFMYDYGYALYKCGKYAESIMVLKEGTKISSDPMFYNILGRNYEALGCYADARYAYLHSHQMVPQRIYPLYLLMRMELRNNGNDEAVKYGEMIMKVPVNKKHRTMIRLRSETQQLLDSLMPPPARSEIDRYSPR